MCQRLSIVDKSFDIVESVFCGTQKLKLRRILTEKKLIRSKTVIFFVTYFYNDSTWGYQTFFANGALFWVKFDCGINKKYELRT